MTGCKDKYHIELAHVRTARSSHKTAIVNNAVLFRLLAETWRSHAIVWS